MPAIVHGPNAHVQRPQINKSSYRIKHFALRPTVPKARQKTKCDTKIAFS